MAINIECNLSPEDDDGKVGLGISINGLDEGDALRLAEHLRNVLMTYFNTYHPYQTRVTEGDGSPPWRK